MSDESIRPPRAGEGSAEAGLGPGLAARLEHAFEAYKARRYHDALALADTAIGRADGDDPGIRPILAKLHQLRGVIFSQNLNDYPRATAEFTSALDMAPEDREVRICLIACKSSGPALDWERVIELTRPLLVSADEATARFAYETMIQALLITPSPTTAEYRDLVTTWSERFIRPQRAGTASSPTGSLSQRPLRIGFVHRSFSNRRYDPLVIPLFRELRRCGTVLTAVSTTAAEIATLPELEGAFDNWVNIAGLDTAAAVRTVAAMNLDVLINLDGFTSITEFDLFARRPASLLVSWHNTHYTFGGELFDCIIADTMSLSAVERKEYAEDIIDIEPCYFAVEPPVNAPPVVPTPALASGTVVFGSMNRPNKIGTEVAASWSRILDAVPGSWLFLRNSLYSTPFIGDLLRTRLHAAGISPDRIVLPGAADEYEFLESYGFVDIALDSFPFSGAFTTYQALWQGVPVVTFPGDRWAARMSAAVLRSCGLSELIATDREAYEALAISLARDIPRLAELRSTIRDRVARSPIVDMPGFARQFLAKLRERLVARYGA